jgi:hypothetical protein
MAFRHPASLPSPDNQRDCRCCQPAARGSAFFLLADGRRCNICRPSVPGEGPIDTRNRPGQRQKTRLVESRPSRRAHLTPARQPRRARIGKSVSQWHPGTCASPAHLLSLACRFPCCVPPPQTRETLAVCRRRPADSSHGRAGEMAGCCSTNKRIASWLGVVHPPARMHAAATHAERPLVGFRVSLGCAHIVHQSQPQVAVVDDGQPATHARSPRIAPLIISLWFHGPAAAACLSSSSK